MRLVGIYLLGVLLAVVLHLTWHFSLPSHHAFSLHWSYYWILPILGFFAAGLLIARSWPDRALRTALWVALIAFVLNQGVVPMLAVLAEEKRFGYPTDPIWWDGFLVSAAIALPLLFGAAWLFRSSARVGSSALSRDPATRRSGSSA